MALLGERNGAEEVGMGATVLLEFAGAVLAFSASIAILVRYVGGRGARAIAGEVHEPRSLVQVLTSPEQLEDAVRRASLFERELAARASERAQHYEAMGRPRPSETYPDNVHRLPSESSDAQRRSAS